MFAAVASAAPARVGEFKPQDFANLAWAFATLDARAPAFFEALAEAARPQLLRGDFSPREVSNLAWAYSKWTAPPWASPGSVIQRREVREF